jgi:predicted AlkP superfamily phosphohydrolase/phosphomutase
MLFTETHASDFANHGFLGMADPISGAEPDVLARCRDGLERTYQAVDRWIGELLKLADENTVVVVASDHGGTPNRYGMPQVSRILEEAGLSVYTEDENGKRVCDFRRSRAVLHPHNLLNIFVNVAGRDPQGIVDPADVYETQLEIIDALYAYREPASGHCPFSVVLTKDDARMVNLWGERLGDVVYALRPEYDGAHGRQLPTARLGIGSQRSTFVIAGPGVRAAGDLKHPVRVVDVAPTVCHLIGLPIPSHVEGRIVREALELGMDENEGTVKSLMKTDESREETLNPVVA